MTNSIGLIESKGIVALVEAVDVILKNSPVKILWIKKLDNSLVSLAVTGQLDYVKAAIDSAVEAGNRVGEIYAHSVVEEPDVKLIELFEDFFDLEKSKVPVESKKSEKPIPVIEDVETEKKQKLDKDVKTEKSITLKADIKKKQKSKNQPTPKKEKPPEIEQSKKSEIKDDTNTSEISSTLSTIERLRKEALGITIDENDGKVDEIVTKKEVKIKNKISNLSIDFDAIKEMNVHKLRHYARGFENFPIKGREISRANREELVDLFKTMS